ncbi:hypothetical protein EV424DRAFT_1073940 [Suillus variegatus]|nr:hypothetical protein EV424DRAFT_1073940 [Suillus variegatus]
MSPCIICILLARPWVVCVSDSDQSLLQLTRWDPEALLKWDATVHNSPPDEDKPYQSYVSIVFATWPVALVTIVVRTRAISKDRLGPWFCGCE